MSVTAAASADVQIGLCVDVGMVVQVHIYQALRAVDKMLGAILK